MLRCGYAVSCTTQESDILFFYTQVHKLQPGFFIAVDREQQKLMWVIRGETHSADTRPHASLLGSLSEMS
jgi:hypothetical protein